MKQLPQRCCAAGGGPWPFAAGGTFCLPRNPWTRSRKEARVVLTAGGQRPQFCPGSSRPSPPFPLVLDGLDGGRLLPLCRANRPPPHNLQCERHQGEIIFFALTARESLHCAATGENVDSWCRKYDLDLAGSFLARHATRGSNAKPASNYE